MKITLLKTSLLSLILFCFSCKSSEVKKVDQQTTATTDKGEITAIFGVRNISGIYPHLTTYAHARENGTYSFGNECGIGGLAVWNEKLYIINYAAHEPKASAWFVYQ